jgi:hypothetical protein
MTPILHYLPTISAKLLSVDLDVFIIVDHFALGNAAVSILYVLKIGLHIYSMIYTGDTPHLQAIGQDGGGNGTRGKRLADFETRQL